MNKDLKTKLNFSTVFYDVDTQNDFMVDPDIHKTPTALYVPGAEHIRKNLQQLTRYAQTNDYCFIMGSVDRHFNDDKELKKNGGPFPDHCIDNTWGQKKIPETMPINPVFIENKQINLSKLEQLIIDKNEVYLEKQHFDVFTNPNTKELLNHVSLAVVYGVATDYCVKAAVLGMRKLDIDVFLVTDAICGVNKETEKQSLKEMHNAGAMFITTKEVLDGKVLRYARTIFGVYQ